MSEKGNEIVETNDQNGSLVLAGDPQKQIEYGSKAADALMNVLEAKKKKVVIGGEQYIEFEDWQVLARFFGATAKIESTKAIEREVPEKDGEKRSVVWGYEARAVVMMKGEEVSSAEAMCTRAEKNWKSRDEFMLRSMAQTRASAKALRNVFGWIPVLRGLKATPAEEMDSIPRDDVRSAQEKREAGSATAQRDEGFFASEAQLNFISGLRDKAKMSKEDFEKKYGDPKNISKQKASDIIEELEAEIQFAGT